MAKPNLSKDFPPGSFAHTVANAVVSIICENVPALKGRNLQADVAEHSDARRADNFGDRSAASAFAAAFIGEQHLKRISKANLSSEVIDVFQNRLVAEISQEIRQQGKNFKYLDIYIRDQSETRPAWLNRLIESVGQETGFNLHSLMPYREKIAIAIHADGEIFWGASGYGPAQPTRRLDYVGKPENSIPFIDRRQIQPDTKQAYVLDFGHYRPVIVADDRPYHGGPSWDSIFHQIADAEKVIARQEERLAKGDYYEKSSHLSRIAQRDFYKSLLSMWQEQGHPGCPYPYVAFVSTALIPDLSEDDFCDIEVLRELKKNLGVFFLDAAHWKQPIEFTAPHQHKWAGDFLFQGPVVGQGAYPLNESSMKSFKGYGKIDTVFRREGDHFRLISQPFYLSEVSAPIQTGIGRENIRLNKGEKLLFTISRCPIGQYKPEHGEIYRFPKSMLQDLRLVEAVTHPFNDEGYYSDNFPHLFGAQLSSSAPNLVRMPSAQISLKI